MDWHKYGFITGEPSFSPLKVLFSLIGWSVLLPVLILCLLCDLVCWWLFLLSHCIGLKNISFPCLVIVPGPLLNSLFKPWLTLIALFSPWFVFSWTLIREVIFPVLFKFIQMFIHHSVSRFILVVLVGENYSRIKILIVLGFHISFILVLELKHLEWTCCLVSVSDPPVSRRSLALYFCQPILADFRSDRRCLKFPLWDTQWEDWGVSPVKTVVWCLRQVSRWSARQAKMMTLCLLSGSNIQTGGIGSGSRGLNHQYPKGLLAAWTGSQTIRVQRNWKGGGCYGDLLMNIMDIGHEPGKKWEAALLIGEVGLQGRPKRILHPGAGDESK